MNKNNLIHQTPSVFLEAANTNFYSVAKSFNPDPDEEEGDETTDSSGGTGGYKL